MNRSLYDCSILRLSLAFILILSACEKPEDPPPKITCFDSTLDNADFENCAFQKPTYWVYLNQVTNDTDSVFIVSSGRGITGSSCQTVEYYSYQTRAEKSGREIGYAIIPAGLYREFNGLQDVGTLIFNDYGDPDDPTHSLGEKLATFSVHGVDYSNVLRVEVGQDRSEYNRRSVYYINSAFGILRHDIFQEGELVTQNELISMSISRY